MNFFASRTTMGRRLFFKVTSLASALFVFSYRKMAYAADYLATRIMAIYTRDSGMSLRKSQDNSSVTALYTNFLGTPLGETSESLLHTSYVDRSQYAAVEDNTGGTLPIHAAIRSVSPNPFNNTATITFDLASGYSSMVIYSVSGQKVREFPSVSRSAGTHSITWDGTTDSGRTVSSGVYIVRLHSRGHVSSARMTLMK